VASTDSSQEYIRVPENVNQIFTKDSVNLRHNEKTFILRDCFGPKFKRNEINGYKCEKSLTSKYLVWLMNIK